MGKRDGNDRQTARGRLILSKDTNALAVSPASCLLGKHRALTETRPEGLVLAPSRFPRSPVQLPAQKYLPSIPL